MPSASGWRRQQQRLRNREAISLYWESGSLSLTPLCCVSGSVVSSTPSQRSSSTSTQARAKACGSSRLLTLSAPALAVAARRAARAPCTTAETGEKAGVRARPRGQGKVWARKGHKGHARVSSSSPSPQPAAKTSRSAAESQTTECALEEGACRVRARALSVAPTHEARPQRTRAAPPAPPPHAQRAAEGR